MDLKHTCTVRCVIYRCLTKFKKKTKKSKVLQNTLNIRYVRIFHFDSFQSFLEVSKDLYTQRFEKKFVGICFKDLLSMCNILLMFC